MGAREDGYYGPSPEGLTMGFVLPFLAVAGVVLAIALCCLVAGDGADAGGVASAHGGSRGCLAVDVDDAWDMHRAGLPTKSDVLSWHMYGRWGFTELVDGARIVHIEPELPGGAAVWDTLYGLDPESKAFKYK